MPRQNAQREKIWTIFFRVDGNEPLPFFRLSSHVPLWFLLHVSKARLYATFYIRIAYVYVSQWSLSLTVNEIFYFHVFRIKFFPSEYRGTVYRKYRRITCVCDIPKNQFLASCVSNDNENTKAQKLLDLFFLYFIPIEHVDWLLLEELAVHRIYLVASFSFSLDRNIE